MDEDLLKRNTDCVYFLASPLTCKKGADCEYRHNEIARLNPRDCWYWLSGNCLNPKCAFRHPPLEGHTGVPSEPTQPSLPANKTVPCYFFSNGFCNKGDRCSFLHAADYSPFPGKPGKNDSGSNDALPPENKISSGNKADVAITTETYPDPSEISPEALHNCIFDPVEDPQPQRSVLKNVKQQDTLPVIFDYEYNDATVIRPDSVSPEKDFVHSISQICTDQSTDEQVHNHMEPEERLESSPGFDVLVDDEIDNPAYEDDSEYIPGDRERRQSNGQYLQYEFEDTVEYDPEFSEADILYEEMYGGCRFMDGDHILADDRIVPAFSRERIIDSIMSRKRIRLPAEMTACDRNLDLRDHLSRRREVNGRPITGFLRRRESSCLMIQNQERLRRHGFDQRLSRRLTSEVGFNALDSNGEGEARSISNRHRLFRYPLQHSPRRLQHYRENRGKQQFLPSKIFRKPFSKRRRYTPVPTDTAFHGPKTLAEIKEEKAIAAERGHFNSTSADFQDPKPLSEILKDKKRLDCE